MEENNEVKTEETAPPSSSSSTASENPEDGEKRRPGRPRKSKHDERPLTPEAPPVAKKPADQIANTNAAIRSTVERLEKLVAMHRERYPESDVGDVVNPLETKKAKLGAPMEKSAFHAPVIGVTKFAGWIGNLDAEEMPKQEEYDRCADAWARASTQLGLSEKMAALLSAGSMTLGVVGFTAARAIKKAFFSERGDDAEPSKDAPVVELARAREQEGSDDAGSR